MLPLHVSRESCATSTRVTIVTCYLYMCQESNVLPLHVSQESCAISTRVRRVMCYRYMCQESHVLPLHVSVGVTSGIQFRFVRYGQSRDTPVVAET